MLTNCLSLNFCVNVSLTRSAKQLVALLRAEAPSAEAGSPERGAQTATHSALLQGSSRETFVWMKTIHHVVNQKPI